MELARYVGVYLYVNVLIPSDICEGDVHGSNIGGLVLVGSVLWVIRWKM